MLEELWLTPSCPPGYENDGIFDWSQPTMNESVSTDHFQKQAGAGSEAL